MRRPMSLALPAVLAAVLLGLTGCSVAAEPRVLPAASVSPVVTGTASATPSATVTASPAATPTPSDTPTATCADGHVTVSQSRATESGPHGSVRVTGSDAVALTFDDGPDPVNTPAMLDVLKACGVKATFCLIGNKVRMYAAVVRRIVAEGHTLCDHTWDHNTQLGSYGQEMIRQNLQETLDAIHSVVPWAEVKYFRAPGGVWTDDYVTVAHQLGMTPIDWDVDPWDWNFKVNGTGATMTNHIVSDIKSHVRPGSIILSHDNDKPTTVEAYRQLLPWLAARYQLIALPAPDRAMRPPPV